MAPGGCCQAWGVFVIQDMHDSLQKLQEHSLPKERHSVATEPLRQGGLYVAPEEIARSKLSWNCHCARGAAQPLFLQQIKRNRIREIVPALVTLRPLRS